MIPINGNWRYKDENFQKRHFILSSFVRMNIPLSRNVYEFCDWIIEKKYQFNLTSLVIVDNEVKLLYENYCNLKT